MTGSPTRSLGKHAKQMVPWVSERAGSPDSTSHPCRSQPETWGSGSHGMWMSGHSRDTSEGDSVELAVPVIRCLLWARDLAQGFACVAVVNPCNFCTDPVFQMRITEAQRMKPPVQSHKPHSLKTVEPRPS